VLRRAHIQCRQLQVSSPGTDVSVWAFWEPPLRFAAFRGLLVRTTRFTISHTIHRFASLLFRLPVPVSDFGTSNSVAKPASTSVPEGDQGSPGSPSRFWGSVGPCVEGWLCALGESEAPGPGPMRARQPGATSKVKPLKGLPLVSLFVSLAGPPVFPWFSSFFLSIFVPRPSQLFAGVRRAPNQAPGW